MWICIALVCEKTMWLYKWIVVDLISPMWPKYNIKYRYADTFTFNITKYLFVSLLFQHSINYFHPAYPSQSWNFHPASPGRSLHCDVIKWKHFLRHGYFTNVSRALQNNLAKYRMPEITSVVIISCWKFVRIPMALGTRTKFQLEILMRNYASETTPCSR